MIPGMGGSMSKFLKRILTRESSIHDWLSVNGHKKISSSIQEFLESQKKESLLRMFEAGLDRAFKYCANNSEIKALDFSWYYAGRETGEALAYGYLEIKTRGTLARSDLGPEEIPGVEIKSSPGDITSEHFAGLPTHIALNAFVNQIKPITDNCPADVVVLTTDLINLWNYQRAMEAMAICMDREKYGLSPEFWVTMTRHERGSVPIAHIK
jgi:hypothetical protein